MPCLRAISTSSPLRRADLYQPSERSTNVISAACAKSRPVRSISTTPDCAEARQATITVTLRMRLNVGCFSATFANLANAFAAQSQVLW